MKETNYMLAIEPQTQATKTLIKFCEDHDCNVRWLDDVRACLKALRQNDATEAIRSFKKVPLGGMGCFNDWLPPAKYSNETSEYVSDLFQSLVGYWSLLMRKLADKVN